MYIFCSRYCLAASVVVFATACGGGGEADSGNGGLVVTDNGVFTQPGPFTTSDSFTNVLERIQNPHLFEADRRTMPVFGYISDFSVAYDLTPVDPNIDPEATGTIVEGQRSYDNISAELLLEKDQIRFIDPTNLSRPREYKLESASSLSQIAYSNSTGGFVIDLSSDGVIGNFIPQFGYGTIAAAFDSRIATPISGVGSSVSGRIWPTVVYGLKTAAGDAPRGSTANGTALNTVRYSGLVFALTGPGTPIFRGIPAFKYQDQLSVGCEGGLDMTLDLTSGVLTTISNASGCTTPNGDDQLQFAMTPITFENSTVVDNSFNRNAVSLTATGRLVDSKVDQSNNPRVTHSVTSNKLTGAIFGVGASSIVISGSGTNGAFMVLARRVTDVTP